MAFTVVLDANVLFPFSLRDTLLRLAEAELFRPVWSPQILDEMRRNLVENGQMDEALANRLQGLIEEAFEEASVSAEAVTSLEGAMTNDAKDRHVLAAAVVGHAEAIVTINLKDFPADACDPYNIEALHPDEFLLILLAKAPIAVRRCVERQAADLKRPPVSMDELCGMLSNSVPKFAAELQTVSVSDGV